MAVSVSVNLTGVYAEASSGFGFGWGVWGRGTWGSAVDACVETGAANTLSGSATATGLVGSVSIQGIASVTLTGLSASAGLGTVTQRADSRTQVSGVVADTTLGDTSEIGYSNIYPIGVHAAGLTTTVLVWGQINDSQTPNWVQIDDSQGGTWVQVADGNTVAWVQIPT